MVQAKNLLDYLLVSIGSIYTYISIYLYIYIYQSHTLTSGTGIAFSSTPFPSNTQLTSPTPTPSPLLSYSLQHNSPHRRHVTECSWGGGRKGARSTLRRGREKTNKKTMKTYGEFFDETRRETFQAYPRTRNVHATDTAMYAHTLCVVTLARQSLRVRERE